MNSPTTPPGPAVQPATPDPSKPAHFGRWILIVAVVLAAGLAFGFIPRYRQRKALVEENQELAIATVQVVSPMPGKASSALELPAEVRPFQETPIYARASGYLKHWNADIGTRVTAGDLLAQIDAPEVDQQLTGAKAELVQMQAAETLAQTTSERWAELIKTSSVSEQENAEKQADLKLKIATVDAAKANVGRLEQLLSFTQVTAPFSGILTARRVDVGDLISSGKELFRLSDLTKLRVFVRVPQSATPNIAPGLQAAMVIPERAGQTYTAKVVRTSGLIDADSRTLLTELEVDNSKNEIIAGSFAQVSFADIKADPTLVLPSNTLIFRSEGLQVGVVGADGKVQLQKITMGRDFGKTVEILSGVSATDRVILNPTDALTAGATVRISGEKTNAPPTQAAK